MITIKNHGLYLKKNNIFALISFLEIKSYNLKMQGSDWSSNNQAEQELTEIDSNLSKPKEEQYKQEIVSERVTQSIQDDLTTLRNKQFQTPLVFYLKIGQAYIFSFKKKDVATFVVRAVCLAIFVIAIDAFMQYMGTVPEKVKRALIIVSIVQILSFLLVFFLDPGTLLDDQQQKIDQERLYCQTCRIYKSPNSNHCVFCLKCVKGYDHHCSFFSKCIGRRNFLLFWIFIISSLAYGILSIGGLVYPIFQSAVNHQ